MPGPFLKPTAPSDRQKLGKYDLLGRLSTSGNHALWLAAQQGMAGFRKIVVLKSIVPDIRGEEEDEVRMFLEEARIASSFSHPNIAQVFDLDTDDEMLFLAMEFVQGAALSELAAPPLGLVLPTVRDVALALHYAHTFSDPRGRPQPVVHRKVSPKNVMVTFEGTTKLLDFAMAKSLGAGAGSTTSIGQVKGAFGYMSPEQVLGETVDPRTDVFSLGVVLHEGLTGRRLFARGTPDEEMRAVLEEVPPPGVSTALDHVTLKALARNRDHRYQTVLEFARALEGAAGAEMWHAEQRGELVKQQHADRLRQIHGLVRQMQGNSAEHSGLHLADGGDGQTATNPAIIAPLAVTTAQASAVPPPFEGKVTTEHPAFEPPDRDETTNPLMTSDPAEPRPGRNAPTQSMRSPSAMNLKSVPAFRPDGPVHDSGAKPAAVVTAPTPRAPTPHPQFAHVTLDEPTSRSDAGEAQLPPTVKFEAEEPEPRTTIARPHRRSRWWMLYAVLGLAAAGFVAYAQGWLPPIPGLEEEVAAPQPLPPPAAPEPIVAPAPVVAPVEEAVDAGLAPAPIPDAGTPAAPVKKPGKKGGKKPGKKKKP